MRTGPSENWENKIHGNLAGSVGREVLSPPSPPRLMSYIKPEATLVAGPFFRLLVALPIRESWLRSAAADLHFLKSLCNTVWTVTTKLSKARVCKEWELCPIRLGSERRYRQAYFSAA